MSEPGELELGPTPWLKGTPAPQGEASNRSYDTSGDIITRLQNELARERDEIEDMEVAHAKLSEMYCRELQRWVDALATIRKRESLLDRFSENNDNLNKLLARERESRKQAEADAFNAGRDKAADFVESLANYPSGKSVAKQSIETLKVAAKGIRGLSIPQEPAEPESGK